MDTVRKDNHIDLNARIMSIDCESAFNGLDKNEKLYSYYFSRASWNGSKICYLQRSYESAGLFYLINKIFNLQSFQEVKESAIKKGFTDEEWTKLTAYFAGFL